MHSYGGYAPGAPAASSSSGSSSYRDRTAELLSIAERLRKTQGLGGSTNGDVSSSSGGAGTGANGPGRPGDRPGAYKTAGEYSGGMGAGGGGGLGSTAAAAQSEFARRASRIGLSIHETSKKLQKLAKLAKRTSMFDDPAVEIQDLTAVIKQDITALNVAIADLQALREAQAEGGRGSGSSSNTKHSSEHSSTVVDDLKTRLMGATKEFKDVLTMRTENLKVHENRRQLFSATSAATGAHGARIRSSVNAGIGAAGSGSAAAPSWIVQPSGAASSSGSQLFSSGSSGRGHSFDPLNRGEQSQALVANAQDTYMASRSEALQNVETTIVELGSIFRDLATMVAQQGEMAIRIDQDMDDTLANVEGAQGALLKYLNNITSNRALLVKIFFVLLVFLLIFIFFVA